MQFVCTDMERYLEYIIKFKKVRTANTAWYHLYVESINKQKQRTHVARGKGWGKYGEVGKGA